MKIQYCSDLHLEFWQNEMYLRSNPIIPKGEILLLAGDIGLLSVLKKYDWFFDYISDNFKTTYWIPGNHEYYGSDISVWSGIFCEEIRHNIFLVNNYTAKHGNIKFIFSTLWSKISKGNEVEIQNSLGDYSLVRKQNRKLMVAETNDLHDQAFAFLEAEVKSMKDEKGFIMTHHIPTFINYPEKYLDIALREAFAVELSDFIKTSGLDYWLYGHHHFNTKNFSIGKTQLITNQLGYVQYKECLDFRLDAVVEI